MPKISEFFRPNVTWANVEGNWPDMVFSTRVRFARNIDGVAFPQRAKDPRLAELRRSVLSAARSSGLFQRPAYFKTESLSEADKKFLIERHHISRALAYEDRPSGVIVNNDENLSLMINEEDHLRIQSIVSGFSIEKSLSSAARLEEHLGGTLNYAWADKFGFLTACPTNVGTGMRVSCLLHLPALSRGGRMNGVLEHLSRLGVTARGIYGEGTYVLGDFYQISNATCLGQSEEQFCQNVDRVIRGLIRQEIQARELLLKPATRLKTEDSVYRAHGLLRSARTISYEEFMQNLSLVRMGLAMGFSFGIDFSTLNQLTLLMQPAHVSAAAGGDIPASERDEFRASCVRKRI